jgi:hypothetical protein
MDTRNNRSVNATDNLKEVLPEVTRHCIQVGADYERTIRLFGGRIVAIFALLLFASCYIYGIVTYGLFIGIAIGWLPSAIAAWAVAYLAAFMGAFVFESVTSTVK